MSNRYIITHSLIASWAYVFDCYESVAEDAYNEFLSALRREERAPTQAISNGLEFEKLVYYIAAGNPVPDHPWSPGASKVAEYINNAPVQIRIEKPITVGGTEFIIHGVLDSLKCGTIYDVKFCNKSFSSVNLPGKYLNSSQHSAYFYLCPEAYKFVYLVSDGEDIYTETYTRAETKPFDFYISEFVKSLKRLNLYDEYIAYWKE